MSQGRLCSPAQARCVGCQRVEMTRELFFWRYGYGSIPINTIFRGMNIHKSQLFWCSPGVQGFDTLPYVFFPLKSWINQRSFFYRSDQNESHGDDMNLMIFHVQSGSWTPVDLKLDLLGRLMASESSCRGTGWLKSSQLSCTCFPWSSLDTWTRDWWTWECFYP